MKFHTKIREAISMLEFTLFHFMRYKVEFICIKTSLLIFDQQLFKKI